MIVRRAVLIVIPFTVAITALSGLVYVVGQQGQRTGANDPQVQLAEDAAVRLDAGETPAAVVGTGPPVGIASRLAPFVVVDDAAGSALATDGQLDGGPLVSGRRSRERWAHGVNAVTWRPAPRRPDGDGHRAVEGWHRHGRTLASPCRSVSMT